MSRFGRWVSDHLVLFVGLLVLLYMFVPIFIVVLMSFNQPASRQSYSFDGFTLENWLNPCDPNGICESVTLSIQIGLLATLGATILGTLMAFALVRHRFRGRAVANVFTFLPMASPEIVMGSSLLALFVAGGLAGQLGFGTILVAHILFCLSFVVVTVKARLAGLDPRLEQAAMDLYANEWQTFWRVTFPLMLPVSVTVIVIRIIFKLKLADIIINVTAGGPGGATDSVTSFIYREYRDRSNVGYGTLLAMVYLVLIVISVTLLLALFNRLLRRTHGLTQ